MQVIMNVLEFRWLVDTGTWLTLTGAYICSMVCLHRKKTTDEKIVESKHEKEKNNRTCEPLPLTCMCGRVWLSKCLSSYRLFCQCLFLFLCARLSVCQCLSVCLSLVLISSSVNEFSVRDYVSVYSTCLLRVYLYFCLSLALLSSSVCMVNLSDYVSLCLCPFVRVHKWRSSCLSLVLLSSSVSMLRLSDYVPVYLSSFVRVCVSVFLSVSSSLFLVCQYA